MSECDATREQLLSALRGRLTPAEQTRFEQHLETCVACTAIFERERLLDGALEKRPNYALPSALRERLAAQVQKQTDSGAARAVQTPRRFGRKAALFAFASTALTALLIVLVSRGAPNQPLVTEAVNDHLRVLYAEHPIEIESGGIHQVKPWFSGRLDFAPALSFAGNDEFPLQGGAIALFVDRKAATFIFKHRLHTISLFVFRSDGLNWPLSNNATLGARALAGTSAHARGFNTLLWRDGDLGYALVSDVDSSELLRLASDITAP